MPKSISVKCFVIFFAISITIVKAETEFVDCGSLLVIHDVKVEGCLDTPCTFSPGDNVTVEINIVQAQELNISELFSEAYIQMYGQKWSLAITPVNPCKLWSCPLVASYNLTYVAEITLLDSLMKRPGELLLQSTFEERSGDPEIAICVQIAVTLV